VYNATDCTVQRLAWDDKHCNLVLVLRVVRLNNAGTLASLLTGEHPFLKLWGLYCLQVCSLNISHQSLLPESYTYLALFSYGGAPSM